MGKKKQIGLNVPPPIGLICVDFDGCICDEDYPECGKKKRMVRTYLRKLQKMGKKICIFSCRSHQKIKHTEKQMIKYLKDHHIPYDCIERGYEGKPLCDVYIDDRAITYNDRKGWRGVYEEVMRWYAKKAA